MSQSLAITGTDSGCSLHLFVYLKDIEYLSDHLLSKGKQVCVCMYLLLICIRCASCALLPLEEADCSCGTAPSSYVT